MRHIIRSVICSNSKHKKQPAYVEFSWRKEFPQFPDVLGLPPSAASTPDRRDCASRTRSGCFVQTSVQTFGDDNTLISQGDDYMTYSAVDPTDLGPGCWKLRMLRHPATPTSLLQALRLGCIDTQSHRLGLLQVMKNEMHRQTVSPPPDYWYMYSAWASSNRSINQLTYTHS
jgi:hypothetical protein